MKQWISLWSNYIHCISKISKFWRFHFVLQ